MVKNGKIGILFQTGKGELVLICLFLSLMLLKFVESKPQINQLFFKELGMYFHKADELQSLIKGIEFVAANNADECFYYENPLDDKLCRRVVWRWSSARCSSTDHKHVGSEPNPDGLQYPYVVCNIGSGVSVLVVRGHDDYVRVSGSRLSFLGIYLAILFFKYFLALAVASSRGCAFGSVAAKPLRRPLSWRPRATTRRWTSWSGTSTERATTPPDFQRM